MDGRYNIIYNEQSVNIILLQGVTSQIIIRDSMHAGSV